MGKGIGGKGGKAKGRSGGWRSRVVRSAVGLALLPLIAGGFGAIIHSIRLLIPDTALWAGALAGAVCWWACLALLPKPLWIYVAGHELTHALAALLCGVRLKSIRVRSAGGQVELERTNSFITLAPYMIPLYAVAWCAFAAVLLLFSIRMPIFWVSFGLGFAYAFHVSLTIYILRRRQPDFVAEGYFFSAVASLAANVAFILVAAGCLGSGLSVGGELTSWAGHTVGLLAWIWRNARGL